MSDSVTIATWEILQEFGFVADRGMSDHEPALSFDFGNFKLFASAVMSKYFRPIVLFSGVLATPRTLSEVCFETPRGLSRECMAAWIVWNLDRHAEHRRFQPAREVAWLELGRQNQYFLPWEIARAEKAAFAAEEAALAAKYAVRPHCTVDRSVLRLAFKRLAESFTKADLSEPIVVAFDGRVLSFLCHNVETAVVATGKPWAANYRIPMEKLREGLPARLMRPQVEIGIWKGRLEIDRARIPDAEEIQVP